jgi:hypothetical protein
MIYCSEEEEEAWNRWKYVQESEASDEDVFGVRLCSEDSLARCAQLVPNDSTITLSPGNVLLGSIILVCAIYYWLLGRFCIEGEEAIFAVPLQTDK